MSRLVMFCNIMKSVTEYFHFSVICWWIWREIYLQYWEFTGCTSAKPVKVCATTCLCQSDQHSFKTPVGHMIHRDPVSLLASWPTYKLTWLHCHGYQGHQTTRKMGLITQRAENEGIVSSRIKTTQPSAEDRLISKQKNYGTNIHPQ